MKKISVLFTQPVFPHHVVKLAAIWARRQRCRLNALFLWTTETKGADGYTFPNDLNTTDVDYAAATDVDEAQKLLETNIRVFRNACSKEGIDCTVNTVSENYLDTLLDETAFSDLLICNDDLITPFYSVHNLIASAHCPVVLVPQEAAIPAEIIFAYDGTASSILAIKTFAYLFPFLKEHRVYLVSVVASNIQEMEYQSQAADWMGLHFPRAESVLLKGEVKEELVAFINVHASSLVVMGAFGRNALSRFLTESLALTMLKQTHATLFVTH